MAPKTLAEQAQAASVNGQAPDQIDLSGLTFRPLGKLLLNEVVEIERQLGRKVAADMAGDFGADFLLGMLWLELRKQHPQITYEQAGRNVVGDVMDAIYAALVSEDEPEPDPPTGPGGSPGPEPATSAASAAKPKPRSDASTPSSASSTT